MALATGSFGNCATSDAAFNGIRYMYSMSGGAGRSAPRITAYAVVVRRIMYERRECHLKAERRRRGGAEFEARGRDNGKRTKPAMWSPR